MPNLEGVANQREVCALDSFPLQKYNPEKLRRVSLVWFGAISSLVLLSPIPLFPSSRKRKKWEKIVWWRWSPLPPPPPLRKEAKKGKCSSSSAYLVSR